MSREIDMDNPEDWDDDDIIYLRDREQLPQGYELPSHLRLNDPSAPDMDDVPNVGDAGTRTQFFHDERGNADVSARGMEILEDDDDEVVTSFDTMRKGELAAQARARGLDDTGTRQELRDRIVDSIQADADDDDNATTRSTTF